MAMASHWLDLIINELWNLISKSLDFIELKITAIAARDLISVHVIFR